MATIIITSLNQAVKPDGTLTDRVIVDGTVDGRETRGLCWHSHLYPSPDQDPESAARGCQSDAERQTFLEKLLAEVDAGINFTSVQPADLQKFVTKKTE